MEKSDMEKLIKDDPDFIYSPKHQNSLQKFLAKTDNPLESVAIARLLLTDAETIDRIYLESVEELKKGMTEDED